MKHAMLATVLIAAGLFASAEDRPQRVGVMRFLDSTTWLNDELQNFEKQDGEYMRRALGAMLSTDLSKMAGVELVERERVNALYTETKLGTAELTSAETAQKMGGAVGADLLVQGILRRGNGYVRVKSVIVKVADGTRKRLQTIEGADNDLISLERQLFEMVAQELKLKPAGESKKSAPEKPTGKTTKTTLAVLPLENNNPSKAGADIGATIADLVAQEFQSGTPRFALVDRGQVSKLLTEKKLVLSGIASKAEVKELGRMLGAQWMLDGAYVRGGGQLRIDLRLLQPASARVQAAFSATAPEADVRKLAARAAEYFAALELTETQKPDTQYDTAPAVINSTELTAQYETTGKEFTNWLKDTYQSMPVNLERWHYAYDEFTPSQKARGEDFVRQYKRYCFLKPGEAQFHFHLACAQLEIGQLAAAREEAAEAARLGYDPLQTAIKTAKSFELEQNFSEAIAALQRVPPESRLYADYLISELLQAQGEVAQKREYLASVLARNHNFAQWAYAEAQRTDKRREESTAAMRRLSNWGYFAALDCDPYNFQYYCDFAAAFTREKGALDTYKQHAVGLTEKLSEIVDRTGIKYIHFMTERMVYIKDPKLPEGYRWTPEAGRLGDIDYLVSYDCGPKDRHTNGRTVNGNGALIYKFTLGKVMKIMISPFLRNAGDSLVEASPDKTTWTEVYKEVYSETHKLPTPNAQGVRTYLPLDVTKYAAPDGTLYLRFRDATPDGGESMSLLALALMAVPE